MTKKNTSTKVETSASTIIEAAMKANPMPTGTVTDAQKVEPKFHKDFDNKINGVVTPISFDPNGLTLRIGTYADPKDWLHINKEMDAKGLINAYIQLTLRKTLGHKEVGLYLYEPISNFQGVTYKKNVGHIAAYYNGEHVDLFKGILSKMNPGELAVLDYKYGCYRLNRICENPEPVKGESPETTGDRRAIFLYGAMDLLMTGRFSFTVNPNLWPAKNAAGEITHTGAECTKLYLQSIFNVLEMSRDQAQEQWELKVAGKKVRTTIAKANSKFFKAHEGETEAQINEAVVKAVEAFDPKAEVTFVTGETQPFVSLLGKDLYLYIGTMRLPGWLKVQPHTINDQYKMIKSHYYTVSVKAA
jgi:hypothetical protein